MMNKFVSENDPQIDLKPEDFSEEADSTILVRERVRGTKLERPYRKRKGIITAESDHTIRILPKKGQPVVIAKRDVAKITPERTKDKKRTNWQESPKARKVQKSGTPKETVSSGNMGVLEETLPNSETESEPDKPEEIEDKSLHSGSEGSSERTLESEADGEEKWGKQKESKEEDNTTTNLEMPVKSTNSWEIKEKKSDAKTSPGKTTRARRKIRRPNWLKQNVMISAIETKDEMEQTSEPSVVEIKKA